MISVIIPAWNEEANLARAINAAGKSRALNEIIVVDAGSADRTAEVAEALAAQVIHSPIRQRAAQMNLGAERSKGEILLFLHADTILPEAALDSIEGALKNDRVVGGGFARRFDSPSVFLKWTCVLAEIRNRAIGWFLGDQAIFVRRSTFSELGGFSAMDRFEDLDFSRRLARAGRLVVLRPPALSSARRFAREGPLRRTARDLLLTMRYLRDVHGATSATTPGRAVKEHVC
jgi:rSAM/selenodomain-associated transferase 2